MTKEEKLGLLNLVKNGKEQDAINHLLSLEINDSSRNEVIAISSRLKKLNKKNRLGILSLDQSNLIENQITDHLIYLINHPENKPFPEEKSITKLSLAELSEDKKSLGYKISIIGSIASIIGLLLYFLPLWERESPQLTVYVTDMKGNVVLEHKGELNTSIGNRPMRETIGEHGRTNFGDILPQYLDDTITIGFKAEGWEIVGGKNIFIFSGDPIRLKVKKDNSLGIIKGIIKTRDGQYFIDKAKILVNSDTTIFTNANGIFNILLPEQMRVQKATDGYKLTISKEGYKTKTQYYYAKSTDAEIRLEKNKE